MRTIGAKFNDRDFQDCEEIRGKLGLSRTEYVRTALSFFNFVVKYHARTHFTEPDLERSEPPFEGQTEPSEYQTSSGNDQESRDGREDV